jgi:hypothetical protein
MRRRCFNTSAGLRMDGGSWLRTFAPVASRSWRRGDPPQRNGPISTRYGVLSRTWCAATGSYRGRSLPQCWPAPGSSSARIPRSLTLPPRMPHLALLPGLDPRLSPAHRRGSPHVESSRNDPAPQKCLICSIHCPRLPRQARGQTAIGASRCLDGAAHAGAARRRGRACVGASVGSRGCRRRLRQPRHRNAVIDHPWLPVLRNGIERVEMTSGAKLNKVGGKWRCSSAPTVARMV